MFELITKLADGPTFTVAIHGEQKSYTSDKEGKRQAILDGLQAIAPVEAGRDAYIHSNQALQIAAAVIYPDGIQSEEAYTRVVEATAKACALIGYGEEVELGPPHVPFSARGAYRRRFPAVDAQTVLAELAQTPLAGHAPLHEIRGPVLWNKIAWETHNKSFSALSLELQEQVKEQVSAIGADAGWQINDWSSVFLYYRPAEADIPRVRQMVEELLKEARGAPVDDDALTAQAQRAAYGRLYYGHPLTDDVKAVAHDLLRQYRYLTERDEDDRYQPQPVTLIEEAETQLAARLAAFEPLQTKTGPVLLVDEVLMLLRDHVADGEPTEYQMRRLLAAAPVTTALRRLGYKAEPEWLFLSAATAPGAQTLGNQEVFLPEIRISAEARKLQLTTTKGLTVYSPALVFEDESDNASLVYLEMVGPKQSVRANWAALVGKKAHWIGNRRVYLDGMKQHVQMQTKLPCGWTHLVLIHKQVSLQEANPEEPFYLLDDGRAPLPPLFYPMLNRSLAVPILPDWSDYLWQRGRERKLITSLNNGEGTGYAAWRVLPAPAEWEQVVTEGLQTERLSF